MANRRSTERDTVRRRETVDLYGASFGMADRGRLGWGLCNGRHGVGSVSRSRRPAEPESRTYLSKSAADPATAAGTTDDAVSWPRSDAAAAFATAQSFTLNRRES